MDSEEAVGNQEDDAMDFCDDRKDMAGQAADLWFAYLTRSILEDQRTAADSLLADLIRAASKLSKASLARKGAAADA